MRIIASLPIKWGVVNIYEQFLKLAFDEIPVNLLFESMYSCRNAW